MTLSAVSRFVSIISIAHESLRLTLELELTVLDFSGPLEVQRIQRINQAELRSSPSLIQISPFMRGSIRLCQSDHNVTCHGIMMGQLGAIDRAYNSTSRSGCGTFGAFAIKCSIPG